MRDRPQGNRSPWRLALGILLLIANPGHAPAAPAARPPTLLLRASGLGLSDLRDPRLPHLGTLARVAEAGVEMPTLPPGALGLISGLTPAGRAELERAVATLPAARVTTAGDFRLRAAPDRPFGVAADLDALTGAATAALDRGGLVILDPGDLERAARYAPFCFPEPAARHRRVALADLDRLLGALRPAVLARGGQLFLISDQPMTSGPPHVGLWVAAGPGWRPGLLRSSSTRMPGLTARGDLIAALRAASDHPGAEVAPAVSVAPGGLLEVERLARASARVERLRRPAWRLLQGALLLVAILALVAPGRPRLGEALLPAVLVLFLLLLLTGDAVAPPEPARLVAHGALVAATAGLAVAGREASRPLLGAIPLLLLSEIATGGHLLRWSPLGYSVALGARSYGIGNEALGILLGTALLLPFAAGRDGARPGRVPAGCGLYGCTALLVGSPALGANLGGALATALAAALALPVLAGRRARAPHIALAVALLVLLGFTIALWDAARPPEARTHVGRLVTAVAEGRIAPLADVATSKATTALRVALSFWGLLLAVETAVGILMLRIERRTTNDERRTTHDQRPTTVYSTVVGRSSFVVRRLPSGAKLSVSSVSLLLPAAGALLLFNDSGVISAALCLALLPAGLAARSSAARSPRSVSDRPVARRAR